MDWMKDIDWDRLSGKDGYFTQLVPTDPQNPTDPFYRKVVKFKKMLKDKYLWIPDEYRSDQAIDAIINSYFNDGSCTVVYEVGKFQGMLGFVNIMPAYKCEVTFKIWDKDIWGKGFVRAGRKLLDAYTEEFRLKRMSTSSADVHMVKFAEMFGFKREGELPNAFRFRDRFYTKYILGRYGE